MLRASPHLAAQANKVAVFRGATLHHSEADKDGMLPLHWAADRGDLDMVLGSASVKDESSVAISS